jgi:hypothetical protein
MDAPAQRIAMLKDLANYLQRATPFSRFFSLLLLPGTFATFLPDEVWLPLALNPVTVFSPQALHTLFTYWLITPGLFLWLTLCGSLVLSGIILEAVYRRRTLALLLAWGIVAGGVCYALVEQSPIPLVSGTMATSCYAGAALAVILKNRHQATMYGRLYAASLFVAAMVIFDGETQTIARFMAAGAGAVFAVVVPGASDEDDDTVDEDDGDGDVDEDDEADRAYKASRESKANTANKANKANRANRANRAADAG